jgi:hypothetical protein
MEGTSMEPLLLTFKGRKFYLTVELEPHEIAGAQVNGRAIDFSSDQGIKDFSEYICEEISNGLLGSIVDTCLDDREATVLRNHNINVREGDMLSMAHLESLPTGVIILELTVAKNVWGECYVTSWVRDPIGRLWEVSPGEYVEGYHYFTDGYKDMAEDYARLNGISLEEVTII